MSSRTYFCVRINETGAPLFSSRYSYFNQESHNFETKDEALDFIKDRYKGKKRSEIYVDTKSGETVQIGWTYSFRNADLSHFPVEQWNQTDWVELIEITETNFLF